MKRTFAYLVFMSFTLLTTSAWAVTEISMNRSSFLPAQVVIKVGETVRWTNDSSSAHTVTAFPGLAQNPDSIKLPEGAEPFHSGRLNPRKSFEHTFTVPGEYRYVCLPHESHGMIGEIVVEE